MTSNKTSETLSGIHFCVKFLFELVQSCYRFHFSVIKSPHSLLIESPSVLIHTSFSFCCKSSVSPDWPFFLWMSFPQSPGCKHSFREHHAPGTLQSYILSGGKGRGWGVQTPSCKHSFREHQAPGTKHHYQTKANTGCIYGEQQSN